MKRFKQNQGFTLIELLVVIFILGILVALVFATYPKIKHSYQKAAKVCRSYDDASCPQEAGMQYVKLQLKQRFGLSIDPAADSNLYFKYDKKRGAIVINGDAITGNSTCRGMRLAVDGTVAPKPLLFSYVPNRDEPLRVRLRTRADLKKVNRLC